MHKSAIGKWEAYKQNAQNSESNLTAAEFWQLYASGALRFLKRHSDGYYGGYAVSQEAYGFFSISNALLYDYPYEADQRFRVGIYLHLRDALHAVISARLMNQNTAPNRLQLGLVERLLGIQTMAQAEYASRRETVLCELLQTPIKLECAAEMMADLMATKEGREEADRTGRLAKLYTEKEVLLKAFALTFNSPTISDLLWRVVENSHLEDYITVGIAVWAIGRHNRSKDLPRLLEALANGKLAQHRATLERAIQFMVSAQELIPLSPTDEDPFHYWSRKEAESAHLGDRNAQSVFWEKRLRHAVQWSTLNRFHGSLQQFQKDEVAVIRSVIADAVPLEVDEMSDTELLSAALGGNNLAFTKFCSLCLPILRKEVAYQCRSAGLDENVIEECYSAAVEKLVTHIRTSRADAFEVGNPTAWTKAIGRNAFHDLLRIRERSREVPLVTDVYGESSGQVDIEELELLEAYFQRLPTRQREIMTLLHVERLCAKDVAERLSIETTTVYKAQQRAIKSLKRMLGY